MSYHIYTTKALILSYRPYKEADRMYSILTEDLGLIRATATGVRKEVSKLRSALEPFSFSTISLVKGEERWRVTSAALNYNFITKVRGKELISAFARIMMLLEKLIPEEETHKKIYEILEEASVRAQEGKDEAEVLEIHILLSLLSELGYLPKDKVPNLEEAKTNRKAFIKDINEALKVSQLT